MCFTVRHLAHNLNSIIIFEYLKKHTQVSYFTLLYSVTGFVKFLILFFFLERFSVAIRRTLFRPFNQKLAIQVAQILVNKYFRPNVT